MNPIERKTFQVNGERVWNGSIDYDSIRGGFVERNSRILAAQASLLEALAGKIYECPLLVGKILVTRNGVWFPLIPGQNFRNYHDFLSEGATELGDIFSDIKLEQRYAASFPEWANMEQMEHLIDGDGKEYLGYRMSAPVGEINERELYAKIENQPGLLLGVVDGVQPYLLPIGKPIGLLFNREDQKMEMTNRIRDEVYGRRRRKTNLRLSADQGRGEKVLELLDGERCYRDAFSRSRLSQILRSDFDKSGVWPMLFFREDQAESLSFWSGVIDRWLVPAGVFENRMFRKKRTNIWSLPTQNELVICSSAGLETGEVEAFVAR